jgi:GTPase SAR1 family protein
MNKTHNVVIFGDSKVGKTSIILSLLNVEINFQYYEQTLEDS